MFSALLESGLLWVLLGFAFLLGYLVGIRFGRARALEEMSDAYDDGHEDGWLDGAQFSRPHHDIGSIPEEAWI